jgi:hypothetical protein
MPCYHLIKITKSFKPDKKLQAEFENCENNRTKIVHFGAAGASDYIHHHNSERKKRYIERHERHENWKDPTTAGSLSRYVLWNKTSLSASIADYKRRFNLKN